MRILKILATLTFVLSLAAPTFAQSSAASASGSAGAAGSTAAASGAAAGAAAAVSTTVAIAAAAVAAVVVAFNLQALHRQKKKNVLKGTRAILSPFFCSRDMSRKNF